MSSAGIEDVPPEQVERVMRTNVSGGHGGRQRRLHYTCRLTASTRQSLHRFAHELKHRTRLTAVRDHTPTPCASQVFGYVFMVKAVAPHMKEGASIINTVSVRRYK